MKIVLVHGPGFSVHTWSKVCDLLRAEGFQLHIFSQQQSAQTARAFLEDHEVDIFIGHLFHDLPWHDELVASSEKARHRIGLGWDMPQHFSSFTPNQEARFESYMNGISVKNYVNGIKFLISCTGEEAPYEMPEPVRTHGVYHPDAPSLFESVPEYLEWRKGRGPIV
jgi:cobaltochelatase CobN